MAPPRAKSTVRDSNQEQEVRLILTTTRGEGEARPRANFVSDDQLARVFDRELFTAPFFQLDADNRRASRFHTVFPSDASQVWVGTVRRDAVAVDLDLSDADAADWVIHHLTHWCDDHGVFWAVRASGGGPGRCHFIAAPTAAGTGAVPFAKEALVQLADELREALGATRTQVDVRDTLRLLSAPHRHGHARGALQLSSGSPASAIEHAQLRRRPRQTSQPVAGGGSLSTRQRAAVRMVPAGETRSHTEWAIALMLKRQGASVEDAWLALSDASIRADLGHAAERGFGWFTRCVWEKMHVSVPLSSPRGQRRQYDWERYALPTARAVRARWDQLRSTQRRHSIEHVAVVAAARIGPSAQHGAPLPIRDLVEDTGLDAKTIRDALAWLRQEGLLVRTSTFDPRKAERSSDEYALQVPDTALSSKNPSPRSYTPSDALWLNLPRGSFSLHLSLLLQPTSLPLPSLSRLSGYQHQGSPSTRQTQHLTACLASLQQLGALQSPTGQWLLSTPSERPVSASGEARRSELVAAHQKERASFRELMAKVSARCAAAREAWAEGMAQAREAARIARRRQQLAWWSSLSDAEREKRSSVYKEMWANSDSSERRARLARLRSERPSTDAWRLAA